MSKPFVARAFERLTGLRVFRTIPAGVALADDIARFTPGLNIETVVDVGGNIGQTATQFAAAFPHATIHSVEPGDGIYDKLVANTRHIPRIQCHKLALGAGREQRTFVVRPGRELFSHLAKEGEDTTGRKTHAVQVDTLDSFCESLGLTRINVLKIDTEGNDLDVLRGAEALIAEGAIDFIQVETGLNPQNAAHVPFRSFLDWMEARGYFLFGFYDQVHEFRGEPHLRRADAAFISPRIRDRERRPKPVRRSQAA